MRHTYLKLSLALTLGLAAAAPAAPAHADSTAAAIASGFGGLAVGTVLGTALARPAPPAPVYVERPHRVYVEEHCWFEKRRIYDEDGFVVGVRRQRVCE